MSKGCTRKLIIKNISQHDGGTYHCESIDKEKSRVSCKFTIGRDLRRKSVAACTYAGDSFCKPPINFCTTKSQLREKDITSNKKWIRCPKTDNFVLNPNFTLTPPVK